MTEEEIESFLDKKIKAIQKRLLSIEKRIEQLPKSREEMIKIGKHTDLIRKV